MRFDLRVSFPPPHISVIQFSVLASWKEDLAMYPMDFQNTIVGEDKEVGEEERLMYSRYIIAPAIQEATWEEWSMDCGSTGDTVS
jgi:hypothetical protein